MHAEALLSGHAACFDLVFMSDSRDAYFQSSPFEHMVASGGFYAFAEQTRAGSAQEGACCSVQQQPNNRRWLDLITEFMHEPTPIAEQIGAKAGGLAPILNSGVSGGSTRAVRSYLGRMLAALMRLGRSLFLHENPLVGPLVGIDQGVHNWLVHLRR